MNQNPSKRPSARELLNHPFITEKSKGTALISELVYNSIDEINKFRIDKFNLGSEGNSSGNNSGAENQDDDQQVPATIVSYNPDADFGTMVVNNKDTSKNTIQPKEKQEKEKQPEFMKFINQMDLTYDEFNMETDLYKNMQNIKREANEECPENTYKNTLISGHLTMGENSISSENSASVYPTKAKFTKITKVEATPQIENMKKIEERKKSSNSQDTISFKNINVQDTKNLLLSGSENYLEMSELVSDKDLRVMSTKNIEDSLNQVVNNFEKEFFELKQKYYLQAHKYQSALYILKQNTHVKNLQEYEDYAKFSKVLGKTKLSNYNEKTIGDESIGFNSVISMNPIKVNNYKQNNIVNKNIIKK